jgi:hypothetical protein
MSLMTATAAQSCYQTATKRSTTSAPVVEASPLTWPFPVDRRLRHKNTLAVTTGPDLVLPVARERHVSRNVSSDAPGPGRSRSARYGNSGVS